MRYLLALALALLPSLAFAASPALADAPLRAKPADSAAVIGKVKKGDKISVLKEQGSWAYVQPGAGKPGWVPVWVARELPKATADVRAAEADTALALRECPVRKALVVATKEDGARVETSLEASKTVDVLAVRSDVPQTTSPAGGVDVAVAIGAPHACDVVIGIAGSPVRWEIVHVKEKKVLASGQAKTLEEASATILYQLERASHDTHHAK